MLALLHSPSRPLSTRSPGWPPGPAPAHVRGLHWLIRVGCIASILKRTARSPERRRRLPTDPVIRLVIAVAPSAADSIPEARRLHPRRDEPKPTDSALSQARRRLGVGPLRPMATHQTIGATCRGYRLTGLDRTTFYLHDTPENARTFGQP